MRIPRAVRASGKAPAEIRKDLALVLGQDQAVYFRFGPEGAVMAVKASEKSFALGDAIDTRWRHMSPEERAQAVLGFIRKAAAYSRRPRMRWDLPGRGAASPREA